MSSKKMSRSRRDQSWIHDWKHFSPWNTVIFCILFIIWTVLCDIFGSGEHQRSRELNGMRRWIDITPWRLRRKWRWRGKISKDWLLVIRLSDNWNPFTCCNCLCNCKALLKMKSFEEACKKCSKPKRICEKCLKVDTKTAVSDWRTLRSWQHFCDTFHMNSQTQRAKMFPLLLRKVLLRKI